MDTPGGLATPLEGKGPGANGHQLLPAGLQHGALGQTRLGSAQQTGRRGGAWGWRGGCCAFRLPAGAVAARSSSVFGGSGSGHLVITQGGHLRHSVLVPEVFRRTAARCMRGCGVGSPRNAGCPRAFWLMRRWLSPALGQAAGFKAWRTIAAGQVP